MIRRISTLLFLLMLAITPGLFAQTAVGIYVSPDINRATSILVGNKPVNNFGVTLGLSFQTSLSKRLSVLYGLQYAPRRVSFKGNFIFVDKGNAINITSIKSRQQFLEVPLQLRFALSGRGARLTPYVQAGVVGHWRTSIRNEYSNDRGKQFEGEPQPSQFELSPEVGVGVAYRINDNLGLNVQPTLRMQLENPTFISRIGLGTTLFFKF